jgi:FMN phosphatase YigB (HAD superfamily)
MTASELVCLVDVDNTLLDNDHVQEDLGEYLAGEFGTAARDEYWAILGQLWNELGYRDYLGALQRYRVLHPHDVHLLALSEWLIDYPFDQRLYPGALDVLAHLQRAGETAIVSDGDVVFQPRKIRRSGIWHATDGRVLVYIHKEKELADIERRFPAQHYVLIDDKVWILAAFKQAWGERVTTVFPRQGQYARDPKALAANPAPDVTIERIADVLTADLPAPLRG